MKRLSPGALRNQKMASPMGFPHSTREARARYYDRAG